MNAPRLLLPTMFLVILTAGSAQAACPSRLSVGFGDTLSAIARTCGINVETLRAANPGLNAETLRPGRFINVPRPPLPTPQMPVGRPSVRIAPSLVPPATAVSPPNGTVPASPPAILHPQVPRGFDVRPPHMRPPPQHPALDR